MFLFKMCLPILLIKSALKHIFVFHHLDASVMAASSQLPLFCSHLHLTDIYDNRMKFVSTLSHSQRIETIILY